MKNEEFNELFRKRTLDFALAVIAFLETVPNKPVTWVMPNQLCKAATSVGANFRAFCRSRSNNERFAKICIVVEEPDESQYWIELFSAKDYGDKTKLPWLTQEALEITKITTSIKQSLYSTK